MSKLDPDSMPASWLLPRRRPDSRPAHLASVVVLCSLCMGVTLASNCGTTHAVLNFTAPKRATAGSPFTVSVTVTINGNRDTAINSRLHFTSSDPTAIVPGDYYFLPADAGSHTWTNGFILMTPGNQTISGDVIDATGINGTVIVSVSP